jgi:excinuclease UvrABC ATPase subunit
VQVLLLISRFAADHVVDMGPGAGINGGNVVFSGTPQQLIGCENSLTGQYLSGKLSIPVPKKGVVLIIAILPSEGHAKTI